MKRCFIIFLLFLLPGCWTTGAVLELGKYEQEIPAKNKETGEETTVVVEKRAVWSYPVLCVAVPCAVSIDICIVIIATPVAIYYVATGEPLPWKNETENAEYVAE